MKPKATILIADDEQDLLDLISYNLEKAGYEIVTAANGIEALEKAQVFKPQLIILDIMMPFKTGIEVCNTLRNKPEFNNTLIIMLTALNDEVSHIKGLDSGADDYISKPVSSKVLVSKVNALLRRSTPDDTHKTITIANISIDPVQYTVKVNDEQKVLAKKEFELLYMLAATPGRVFLRNEILSQIWGSDVIVGDRTIDVHIRKIRQKLDLDCISTVKGVGYKFVL
jgi:two-component system, OmpR family, alkaline phosphatase synthesis response regulator PhoP